jgi:Kef-type K+ transport system membrane component KefB
MSIRKAGLSHAKPVHENESKTSVRMDWKFLFATVICLLGTIAVVFLTVENIWTEDDIHGDPDKPEKSFSFNEMYSCITFLIAVWASGKVANFCKMPSLVGEIVVGVILGPNLLEFAPKTGALKMLGEIGLMLLVVEAGVDVDLEMLRTVGLRGMVVAIVGSIIPLGIGFAIGSVVMDLDVKGAFVVGASVAPTSMGIALNVLRGGGVLQTPVGQLIITAAVLDDIIALILLSEIEALENPSAWGFIGPVVSAVVLLLFFGAFAIRVTPYLINSIVKPRIPEHYRENVILGLVFAFTLVLAPLTKAAGSSHLLGCFFAGLCFCTDSHTIHHAWTKQVMTIMTWLLRLFFACTIGFEIPIKNFGNLVVIEYGMILFLAVVGKLVTGWLAPPPRTLENMLTISFAMAAWGEFAFIVVVYGKDEVHPSCYRSIRSSIHARCLF